MVLAHALRPFAPQAALDLSLSASARRSRDSLALGFCISSTAELLLPDQAATAMRCDGLWQHTCLEAFVADPAQQAYWEFNLAPSGHWNVYRLAGYREGLEPEPCYGALPFAVAAPQTPGGGLLSLELRCDLPPALHGAAELAVGLTAVLEERSGALSYWALAHPGAEPDFHDRRGWTLRL